MVFLNPGFLYLGLGAAALPLVIHLIMKQRARKVPFSTLRFLVAVDQRLARRNRLREILLLLLRMAALLALAFALSKPQLQAPGYGGLRSDVARAVILDDSASMNRLGPGLTCFERAKRMGAACFEALEPGDRAALFTIRQGRELTTDHASLRAQLNSTTPGHGGSDPKAALEQALESLDKAAAALREVILLTDLQRPAWTEFINHWEGDAQGIKVVAIPGPDTPNLTVEQVDTAAWPGETKVHVRVRNHSASAQTARLIFQADQTSDQVAEIGIPPEGTVQHTFVVNVETHGIHRGAVRLGPDVLEADNVRFFLFETRTRCAVLLVASGEKGFYIERALQPPGPGDTHDPITVFRIDPGELHDLDLEPYDAVVLLDPVDSKMLDYVHRGGSVLVMAGDPESMAPWKSVLRFTRLVEYDTHEARLDMTAPLHPVFAPLAATHPPTDLSTPLFRQYLKVTLAPDEKARLLMRFMDEEDPALVEVTLDRGRALFLMSDCAPGNSDFPFKVSFVPFLHATVSYLCSSEQQLGHGLVENPLEAVRDYSAGPGADWIPCSDTRLPGFYRTGTGGWWALNVDPLEGDLTCLDPAMVEAKLPGIEVHVVDDPGAVEDLLQVREGLDLMPLLLLITVGLMAYESYLSNRRVSPRRAS